MGLGQSIEESGTLDWSAVYRSYVLYPDGGGFWIVDLPFFCRPRRYLGRHVTAAGIRVGFNILSLNRITLA